MTRSVTLCPGTDVEKLEPAGATSASRAMALEEESCQTCALPAAWKFETLTVIGVVPVRYLLTTITVKAPSEERTAAKLETLSGFGPPAETLVSPNVDLLPS